MQIGNALRALFAKPEPKLPPEQGWSESLLYGSSDFPKYNPDDLMGRKGWAVYRRMMQDEQVKAVVKFRRDAITARDWHFVDPELDDADESERRVNLSYAVIDNLRGSWQDAMNGVMSGMYNGFSLSEKVYGTFEFERLSWVGVECLKLRPFDTFLFHVDKFGNVTRVVQKVDGREQDVDPAKFIHYVHNPEIDDHYGASDLREAYRSWFSKDFIIKFQNIFLERNSSGTWVASPKDGQTLLPGSAQFSALQTILNTISTTTSIVLPSNVDLRVESPKNNPAFEAAIAQHDKAIAKALLVPNLMGISEQGSTGSFAQSQTQLEAFLWTLEADTRRLEDTLNEQLFRDLADRNWGDGEFPRFAFKPVSDAKKYELVRTWKDLVVAGAVQASMADEQYLRETLEMPARVVADADGAPGEKPNLNGAQVASIVDIAARVAKGELSEDAATAIITSAFPIAEERAREMVKPPEKEPVPAALAPFQPGVPPQPQPEAEGAVDQPVPPAKEETVRGVGTMRIAAAAFSKAMARVDFAVIKDKTELLVSETTLDIARLNADLVRDYLDQAEALNLGTAEGDPADFSKLHLDADKVGKMKRAAIAGLKQAWAIGTDHAVRELEKSRGKRFATNDLALQDVAAKFLEKRGFDMAGSVTSRTKAVIENLLLEGIKSSRTFAEVEDAVWAALASQGLVDEEAVAEALGVETEKAADARIHTIVRTNTFQSVNEARYQLFSDPELDGFVQALEFSAILDDRTTQVCEFMDGHVHPQDSGVWGKYRPPLHFNCRSLLIAVTERDTWTESDEPTDSDPQPQEGFGF